MTPVTTFKDKTVALFGLGGSGLATAKALIAGGAHVRAWDDGEAGRLKAVAQGVTLEDLARSDWSQYDAFILSPGVPLTHPEPHWTAQRARAAGVEIIGDIELFCRERAALESEIPRSIIASLRCAACPTPTPKSSADVRPPSRIAAATSSATRSVTLATSAASSFHRCSVN